MKLLYTLIILFAFFMGCDKDPVTPEPEPELFDCTGTSNSTAIEDFNGQCCEVLDLYCCGVGCIPECEVLSDIVESCGIDSVYCVAEGSEIIDGSPAPEDILTDCGSRTVDSPEPPDSPFEP